MNTPQPTPPQPDQMSPAQQRAERARQRAFLLQQQQEGAIPIPQPAPPLLPTVGPRQVQVHPARKQFHAEDLRRMPVEASEAAQAILDASSSQGRIFKQALQEILGAHQDEFGQLERICVDVVPKSTHFAIMAEDLDPTTGQEPLLMVVRLLHESGQEAHHHQFLINASILSDLHPQTRVPMFSAEIAAKEFLRLYQHQRQMVRHEEEHLAAIQAQVSPAETEEPQESPPSAQASMDTPKPRRRSSATAQRRRAQKAPKAEEE